MIVSLKTVPHGRIAGALYRRISSLLPLTLRFAVDGAVAIWTGKPNLVRHLDLSVGILRRRLWPQRMFIGWLLHGDENDGASRVHALLPHAYLRRRGVNSVILRKPRIAWVPFRLRPEDVDRIVAAGLDVVVFQGVHSRDAEALARALRSGGTKTVFVSGDLVQSDMPALVDRIVVASEGLKQIAMGHLDKALVIESVIDAPTHLVKDYSRSPDRDEIRVVWVGYPQNLHLLAPVREALRDPRLAHFRLITISTGPGATFQWHRERVWHQVLDCDIAVLPSNETDWYHAKPNTRMTMFKVLGLPIVASPTPSYVATLRHGESCYFARDTAEWSDCLAALSEFDRRREIGLADRERIIAEYGVETIGGRWLRLFEQLTGGASARPEIRERRPHRVARSRPEPPLPDPPRR